MSTHVFLGDLGLGNAPYPVVVLNALSSILIPAMAATMPMVVVGMEEGEICGRKWPRLAY
jgi:hypothetical protein